MPSKRFDLRCYLSEGLISRSGPDFEYIASLLDRERIREIARIGDITVLYKEDGVNCKRFTMYPIADNVLVTYRFDNESENSWLAIKRSSSADVPIDYRLEIGCGDIGFVSDEFFVEKNIALQALKYFLESAEIDTQLNWKNLELAFEYLE